LISLSWRNAIRPSRISRGDMLASGNFRLTGGPHWASPEAVSGEGPVSAQVALHVAG
jgi:hypothetical protein